MKELIKKILYLLHLDITKNQQYDRQTHLIMQNVIKQDSNCIDVGCHKGEMLQLMLTRAKKGKHYAFEPIPYMYNHLKQNFRSQPVEVFPLALSNKEGETEFNIVKDDPAYSGMRQRKYKTENPVIEKIKVKMSRLDDVIAPGTKIDFIKIDVEGAEFHVMEGAKRILTENHPIVIFECGLGASDFYETKPEQVFDLLHSCKLKISLMKNWLNKKPALKKEEFVKIYNDNSDYYFIAHP